MKPVTCYHVVLGGSLICSKWDVTYASRTWADFLFREVNGQGKENTFSLGLVSASVP